MGGGDERAGAGEGADLHDGGELAARCDERSARAVGAQRRLVSTEEVGELGVDEAKVRRERRENSVLVGEVDRAGEDLGSGRRQLRTYLLRLDIVAAVHQRGDVLEHNLHAYGRDLALKGESVRGSVRRGDCGERRGDSQGQRSQFKSQRSSARARCAVSCSIWGMIKHFATRWEPR